MVLVFSRQTNPIYDSRVAFIQAVLSMPAASVDGKYGPITEGKVKSFQVAHHLPNDGKVDEATGRALDLPFWDGQHSRTLNPPFRDENKFPPAHQFVFRSFHEGGYFSDRPDRPVFSGDVRTRRAIRTNNPGALNISPWQRAMPGYVGQTHADNSSALNRTTIYLSPEDGVHAWYKLIVVIYEQLYHLISHGSGSTINVKRLAKAYGLGKPDKADNELTDEQQAVVDDYLAGWKKWSIRTVRPVVLDPNTEIDPNNNTHMLSLASGMFSHEASGPTPLLDAQIQDGIDRGSAVPTSAPALIGEDELVDMQQAETESSLERFQFVLRKLRGELSAEEE